MFNIKAQCVYFFILFMHAVWIYRFCRLCQREMKNTNHDNVCVSSCIDGARDSILALSLSILLLLLLLCWWWCSSMPHNGICWLCQQKLWQQQHIFTIERCDRNFPLHWMLRLVTAHLHFGSKLVVSMAFL